MISKQNPKNKVRILAIETSCDETGVSILEAEGGLGKPVFKVLANSLLSQIKIHQEFGGVVPMLAKREHEKNLPVLLEKTLKEAGENLDKPNIDFIAVTSGPGLEPALWTGIVFAENLGRVWNVPVVPVNHMEGHILSVLYTPDSKISFPALALLVSGGHTELVLAKGYGDYEIIGETKDDAVGEAFDKVARLLELPYPGGPEISKLAEKHRKEHEETSFAFPRPMIHSKDFNFSFSGLKTSVLYKLKTFEKLDQATKEEFARAFEDAAVEVLVEKARRALEVYDVQTLIVAGGVAANKHLRASIQKLLTQFPYLNISLPEPLLATDNAIMIGMAGFVEVTKNPELLKQDRKIVAQGNLSFPTISSSQR